MKIKNYTSSVSVDRSVLTIEHCLVSAGASHISKLYDKHQNLLGIVFQLDVAPGQPAMFKLPARWEKVYAKMWKEVLRPRKETADKVRDQAQRTAWKLLCDQVQVQVSNILIEQQDAVEAFMSYLYDGKRDLTLYEISKGDGFTKLLPAAKSVS